MLSTQCMAGHGLTIYLFLMLYGLLKNSFDIYDPSHHGSGHYY